MNKWGAGQVQDLLLLYLGEGVAQEFEWRVIRLGREVHEYFERFNRRKPEDRQALQDDYYELTDKAKATVEFLRKLEQRLLRLQKENERLDGGSAPLREAGPAPEGKKPARRGRSRSQADIDDEIRRVRANYTYRKYSNLKENVAKGLRGAIKEATRAFGRNNLATRLRCS